MARTPKTEKTTAPVQAVKPEKTPKGSKKGTMSSAHKEALAEGRVQGRAVRDYLDVLEATKPKRGRKRTAVSVERRLALVAEELETASGMDRVHLLQEDADLEAELAAMGQAYDVADLEAGFVAAAAAYGERKGITYATWRTAGVTPAVLSAAGISR